MNMIAKQGPCLPGLYENIPAELKALPQWAVANHDKIPIDPKTGRNAKVGDRSTWGTFEEAIAADYPLIGFMFSEADPYCVIDLDNKEANPASEEELARYQSMIENFDSYTERSTSGRGYHIVVKARLEQGRRRDKVEIYSSLRFMVFTGDVVKESAIQDRQYMVDHMVSQLEPVTAAAELEETKETLTDKEVFETAMRASDGDKFDRLCRGEWQAEYESQSQADHALLCMLAFYSRSNEQCRRLFRMSALGQRDKAQKDSYLNLSLRKFRAKQPPPVDMEALEEKAKNQAIARADSVPNGDQREATLPQELYHLPHGLGPIQDFVYGQMIYPDRYMAGIVAFAIATAFTQGNYTIDSFGGLGLNEQYIILAPTSRGKEAARRPLATLHEALLTQSSGRIDPRLIPQLQYSAPASAQALHRFLEADNSQVFLADEYADWLCTTKKDPHRAGTLSYFKEAYTRALGWISPPHSVTNTYAPVENPRVTILATTTPESMVEAMSLEQANSGTYNRLLLFVADKAAPKKRYEGIVTDPSPSLVSLISRLAQRRPDSKIKFLTDAWEFFKHYDQAIVEPLKDQNYLLAGRLSEQAIKMAAIIALSDDRTEIHRTDLETAYSIRMGLYHRAADMINREGTFSGDHATGAALEQVRALVKRKGCEYISQLSKGSHKYGKLSVSERKQVVAALVDQDPNITREGKKLYWLDG